MRPMTSTGCSVGTTLPAGVVGANAEDGFGVFGKLRRCFECGVVVFGVVEWSFPDLGVGVGAILRRFFEFGVASDVAGEKGKKQEKWKWMKNRYELRWRYLKLNIAVSISNSNVYILEHCKSVIF